MIDFPSNPSDGQQFTSGNSSWVWNADASQWRTALLPNSILDNTVTTAKIVNANVTAAKLASGAAVSNIGYTPFNKAGDTMLGTLNMGGNAITLATNKTFSDGVWAGGSGYPGYSFTGGNSRFGFSSSTGVIDVYTDGDFYANEGANKVLNAGNYSTYALPIGGGNMSGPIGVGVFTFGGNSGEARLGRANDRAVGVATLQLGGASGQRFEIVDKAWSSVLFSVTDSGATTVNGTLAVSSHIENSGPLYQRSNINVLNSAGNDWLTILDRNGGDPYLSNVKFSTYAYFTAPRYVGYYTSSWNNFVTMATSYDHTVWVRARCMSVENNMPSHFSIYFHLLARHNGTPYGDGWNYAIVWDANTQSASGSSYVSFQMFQDAGNGPVRIQCKNSAYGNDIYITGVEGSNLSAVTWG